MTATITELGARVLRRLGVAVVAAADRPTLTATVPVADIAFDAMSRLGVVVPDASRPAVATVPALDVATDALQRLGVIVAAADRPSVGTAAAADIAADALQQLGVVVPEASRPAVSTVTALDIAENALQRIGVTIAQADRPALLTVITAAEIAERALRALGVVPHSVDAAAVQTTSQMGLLALVKLGVVASDETPGTNDLALAAAAIVNVHASLQQRGFGPSWLVSAVPSTVAEDYATLAAIRLASSFGRPADPAQIPALEARIKQASEAAYAQTAAAARVSAVHDALVGQAAVRWDTTTIPQAVAEDYVALVVLDMGPSVGVQVDRTQQPVIEARVRRVANIVSAQFDAGVMLQMVHGRFVAAGIASWSSAAIPASLAADYAELVAVELAPQFGVAADHSQDAAIEARVRRAAQIITAQTEAVAMVTEVHNRFVAAGFASWAVSAVPLSLSADYARMVAIEMAPQFGQALDRAEGAAIEARVRRAATVIASAADALAMVSQVHGRFVSAGIADWASSAIPVSVAPDYARLVAMELAPQFGQQADHTQEPVVEARVRRLATLLRVTAQAEARVAAIHEGLVAQGLVSWDSAAIPKTVAEDYAQLVAVEVAPLLGVEMDRGQVAALEQRVRRVSLIIGGPALAEQAVKAVHADLDARGRTRWGLADLPVAAEQPYVVLAANHLAYAFGVPADAPGNTAGALRSLAQLIALPTSGERVTADYY